MKLLLSIIFLSLPLLIFSQDDYDEEEYEDRKLWLFEANLEGMNPVNAFGRNARGGLAGFSLSVLRERKLNGPIFWGGSTYLSYLGSHTTNYVDNLTFEEVNDQAISLIMGLDFVLRYYTDFYLGPVEPFFEAMIGPRVMYSYTSTSTLSSNTSSFNVNSWDTSLAYGVGAGVHTTIRGIYGVNTKIIFHPGFISRYIVKGDDTDTIQSDNPLDYFMTESSTTDVFRFQLGFVVMF